MTVFMLLWGFIGMLFPIPVFFRGPVSTNDAGRFMEQDLLVGALIGSIVGFALEQLIRIGQRD